MTNSQEHLKIVAHETLNVFNEISAKAAKKLEDLSGGNISSLANLNTFTGHQAVNNFNTITTDNRLGYEALRKEPAICRVISIDEDGKQQIYYISRKSQLSLSGEAQLASYNSPIGRLAATPVGDEITLNIFSNSKSYEVLEKITYQPSLTDLGWDSKRNIFENVDFGSLSVDSLRALLVELDVEDPEAILDAILAGTNEGRIREGIDHQARLAMELRDQPILDKFQDSIFRLPIDSQLIILGPPGTGKTTTLIKRLGQKLDRDFLDDTEKFILTLEEGIRGSLLPHEQSWLMFTPTDLLKHYVKEAFNREQVPASDQRIKTWESHRKYLARNILDILQSPTSGGKFILKVSLDIFKDELKNEPTEWFDSLFNFHSDRILNQLEVGLKIITPLKKEKNSSLIERLTTLMQNTSTSSLIGLLGKLNDLESTINPLLTELKGESDKKIRSGLALSVNTNKEFLNELAGYLDSIAESDDDNDDEEFDDDSTEEFSANINNVQKAQKAYNQAIRSLARAQYLKRSVSKNSKTALIRDWLGERAPTPDVLHQIGENIATQNGLRRFVNASKRYVSEAASSYRDFRKISLSQNKWYKSTPNSSKNINSMELDAIVLLFLKASRVLLSERFISSNLDDSRNTLLKKISDQFRNQILVDEATDFSPIQLACMESLTNLRTRSFFACGDFNQRITLWGTHSEDQIKWVSKSIQKQTITTVYRQSEKLNKFSKELLKIMNGSLDAQGELPNHIHHQGLLPVLLENQSDMNLIAHWLSGRIREVEKSVKQMPTAAILVNSEDDVKPLADALNGKLEDINLRAVACSDGQSLGEGNDIRVFDVQHIKGLEFEAVFFVAIDELANIKPELFDKYLYVGSTRAATYLGITCNGYLPDKLESVRNMFSSNWNY